MPNDTQEQDPQDDVERVLDEIIEASDGMLERVSEIEMAAFVEAGERLTAEHDDQARNEGRRFLDEDQDRELIETWWSEARSCTSIDHATDFARRLIADYRHDYGTICHAIGAAGLAMSQAVQRSPEGHITGFQAGAVGWLWLRHWHQWGDEPRRLVDYSHLLYPQYDRRFAAIDAGTATWLRDRAAALLEGSPQAHPDVRARWADIAAGRFPAFITVEVTSTGEAT